MGEANSVPEEGGPRADAVSTTGLFLLVTAVIAFAVGMGGFGLSERPFAITAGVIALLSFAGSIGCFTADSTPPRESERLAGSQQPLPLSLERQPAAKRTGVK